MRHSFLSVSRVSAVVFAVGGLLVLGCKKKEEEPASQPPAATAPSPSAPAAATPPAQGSPTQAPATAQAGSPEKPAEAAGGPSAPAQPSGARCSASTLSAQPSAPASPLSPPVESMRRRIIAAAVACDYEALSALAREKGADFTFSFGPEGDLVEAWRTREEKGDPVLAQLVKALGLPFVKLDTLYVWPSAYGPEATPADWSALKALYSAEEIANLKEFTDGYVGFRTGIDESGDWLFAVAGD